MIRTAKGQLKRGFGGISRVQFDRSQKTPSSELIQPEPIKLCHQSSLALADGSTAADGMGIPITG